MAVLVVHGIWDSSRRLCPLVAGLALAAFGSAFPAFAQSKGPVIGVSWSNFQEERWKTDEAAIKAAIEKVGGELRASLATASTLDQIDVVVRELELPAHTVGMGLKGCVTWSTTPVRNYRDYKATDFRVAELSWLWGVNRGVLTPPGLDEQWLVSLAHTQADMDALVGHFRELGEALRA